MFFQKIKNASFVSHIQMIQWGFLTRLEKITNVEGGFQFIILCSYFFQSKIIIFTKFMAEIYGFVEEPTGESNLLEKGRNKPIDFLLQRFWSFTE